MRDILRLGLKLLIISAVGGLALGLTNAVTEGPIAAQQVAAADEARKQVLPGAETFEALDAVEGLDEAHAGRDGSGALLVRDENGARSAVHAGDVTHLRYE